MSLTAYQTDFKDKILRVSCVEAGAWCVSEPANSSGRFGTTYINVDEARIRGVEATISANLTPSVSLRASGTLTDSEQRTGANAGAALNETPKQQASLSLNYRPKHSKFSAYARAVYYGEEAQAAVAISASNIISPAYTMVDVGGAYDVSDRVTLRAGVQNLLDKKMDYETYGYVNDRARVWMGLSARF